MLKIKLKDSEVKQEKHCNVLEKKKKKKKKKFFMKLF